MKRWKYFSTEKLLFHGILVLANCTDQARPLLFKTRGQEMGYTEELRHFINCIAGNETPLVSPDEMFATMNSIFAIEKSLTTANAVSLQKY